MAKHADAGGISLGKQKSKENLAEIMGSEKASAGEPRRLGMALVGLGRAGHFHLESFKMLPELVKLQWVIDTDEEKCKRISGMFGCQWSKDLSKALDDPTVDAVVIASTTDTHFPFIMKSLRSSKAVFTEKPISHDPAEVKEAVDFALSGDCKQPFVVGYQRRVDKNFRELKRRVELGHAGSLRVIKSCSRDNPIPPMEYLRTSGGLFHDMLCHDFDMIHFVTNGQIPESVLSVGHCYHDEIRAMGDIDTCAVTMKFPSGLIAMVDTCREAAYGYDQRLEAFGDKGMLTARNEQTSTVELATADGHLMPCAEWSFPQRYKQAYAVEMVEFVALLRDVKAGGTEALQAERECCRRHPDLERITTAAEISYKLGRQVHLKDLDSLRKECPH